MLRRINISLYAFLNFIIMKFILLFLFIISNIYSQEIYNAKKITDFKSVTKNQSDSDIYSLNATELGSLILSSQKKYQLIYSYATWCKPCNETLPKILKFVNSNNNVQLYIINIEKDNSRSLKWTKDAFIKKFNYLNNTFMVSESYGKRSYKKYDRFIQVIAPGHKDYGLSLIILFDNNKNLLYASTYFEAVDAEITKLMNLTKK